MLIFIEDATSHDNQSNNNEVDARRPIRVKDRKRELIIIFRHELIKFLYLKGKESYSDLRKSLNRTINSESNWASSDDEVYSSDDNEHKGLFKDFYFYFI